MICRLTRLLGGLRSSVETTASDGDRLDNSDVHSNRDEVDPELEAVVTSRPDLPDAIKAGIFAMVASSTGRSRS